MKGAESANSNARPPITLPTGRLDYARHRLSACCSGRPVWRTCYMSSDYACAVGHHPCMSLSAVRVPMNLGRPFCRVRTLCCGCRVTFSLYSDVRSFTRRISESFKVSHKIRISPSLMDGLQPKEAQKQRMTES